MQAKQIAQVVSDRLVDHLAEYGCIPLKSMGRHGHFLNSTLQQGLFLKFQGNIKNVRDKR